MLSFDESFIKKLKQQDHNTFNTFYLETIDILFRYIHANYFLEKENAEDVIASFYVKIWEAMHKYDTSQSFSAYFRTIFKNTLKDYFKKHTDLSFSQIKNEEVDSTIKPLTNTNEVTHNATPTVEKA